MVQIGYYYLSFLIGCLIVLLFNIKYFIEKETWDKWVEKWKIKDE